MVRFSKRSLGFIACECVLEHGGLNGRAHYHMRIKLRRPLKKQKIKSYTSVGSINIRSCRTQTPENWQRLENYMTKENPIVDLLDPNLN